MSSGLVCLQLTAHFEPLFELIGSTSSMLRSQWCLFLPLSAHLPVVLLPTVLTAVSFHCSFSTESVRNRSEFRLRAGGGLCGAASLSRTRSVPEHYRAQCGTRRADQVCRTAARCAFAALHRSQYAKTTGGLNPVQRQCIAIAHSTVWAVHKGISLVQWSRATHARGTAERARSAIYPTRIVLRPYELVRCNSDEG